MATYTSNYGWTKPSGSDNVDISVLNNNLDDQDSTIHDAFLNMAPPFSESSTYAVDDIVLYGTGLYKCHTAVVTPGSWTGSTNWQVYKLSEGGSGGGGGTSNYPDLTNKPQVNGVTLLGNKTTSDLGIDKTAVGLGNVPNVSTNDQTPTFTEASTRNNIASGEKLSVILGKVQKFFNDLKTVAFSGSYTDLSDKPNADDILMSDGVTSVEDALDAVDKAIPVSSQTKIDTIAASAYINYTPTDDGYIGIWCESGSSQKEYKAAIRDNTLTKYGIIITQTIAAYNSEPIGGLYVKKGRTYTIRNAGSNSFDVYFCK